ncbi:MAG: tyrosine-type recombinase/integrase [Lachnospiraceae bacterium]|jgi:integrase/recombinase XerD|nr:tyrosine-type recombinase/integrase [Lachnospiraceae bacterium]
MRKRRTRSAFLEHLEYFINVYMPVTRGLSRNTIISYKTTFTLLITFMYTVKGTATEDITFQMLDQNMLSDFLSWLETERRCCASTKSQRLAALYSFSKFAQNRDFEAASVFRSAVTRIPSKKTSKKRRVGFSVEELEIFLALPGTGSEIALRDTVLLSLMYATGARAQEICDLTVCKIQFRASNTTVDIIGKGAKARCVRIPEHCAEMLKKHLIFRRINDKPERHIFSSQTHEQMTVSCIEEIFKKYVRQARCQYPDLFQETGYSPHCMRHTTGQHMLEAGVPLMVIKAFFGHASVQTTQIYAESSQVAVDKHVREWNERNFPNTLYSNDPDKEQTNVPDFLKSR